MNDRLLRNTELKDAYEEVFHDYLKNDIIEEVQMGNDENKTIFYLPHHPVVKQSSESTKIRPVFDASALDPNGISVNSLLDCGPNYKHTLLKCILNGV